MTALALQQDARGKPLVFLDVDLGRWLDLSFARRFLDRLRSELKMDPAQLIFGLTHNHATPPLGDPEPQWKGGKLLPAYVEKVYAAAVSTTRKALATAQPAILDWHAGRCNLAANRDLRQGKRIVCGYNPAAPADDYLLVGRVTNAAGKVLATLVNYACHPTTLAWQNKLVSPDYLGAMRQTVEENTGGAPALFLQGASGELAPREQYTGDAEIADAHGRHLGFAALATLADMEPPGQELVFDRVVESGAPLAVWKRQGVPVSRNLAALVRTVQIPLKNWPSAAQLEREYRDSTDRALAERLRRKLRIREAIGDGDFYPLDVWGWRIGDGLILGCMVEAYSPMQTSLRQAFQERPVAWMNIINGSIGYVVPAPLYDEDIYQVWQTPFDRGVFEALAEASKMLGQDLLDSE